MSRRKKNAGEGYGYMFHGAFAKKEDAKAKERKTKGAFVKGRLTPRGYRYIVMSERKNPIKRNPGRKTAIKLYRKMMVLASQGKNDWPIREKLAKLNTKHDWTMAEVASWARGRNSEARQNAGYWSERIPAGHGHGIVIWANDPDVGPFHVQPWLNDWETAGREVGKYKNLEMARKKARAYMQKMGWSNPSPYKNPHELMIMGANPHEEIVVQPGASITIRVNPTELNPDRYTSAHARASGARYTPPGLIRTKRQKRVAGLVRSARKHKYDWIPSEGVAPGMNPGDDKYMYAALARKYPGKTLGQLSMNELSQVAMLAAELKKHDTTRPNPSAETIRESFTGMPVEYVDTLNEPHMPKGDYAQLGELLSLHVKPHNSGQVQTITFAKPRPLVVSDESARQLWFVGGDQDVSSSLEAFGALDRGAHIFELGEARRIDYKQRKEHVKDPDYDEWRHNFGEESEERPMVLFDATHKRLLLEGGAYEIRPEGIVN